MKLSIIIPTHQRPTILRRCLEHLEKQTIAHDLEVIVVSDGHDPETATQMATREWQIANTFLEVEKSQQGTARNRGVEKATAPITLFIGDDIFLAPDACEKHVHAHNELQTKNYQLKTKNFAVLGFTTWDPSLEITDVMRWLEKTGWQFGYPQIERYKHRFIPKEMQHRFTYTSHISLPTEIAKKIRFREDVSLYGWEDMEWGLRLREAGIQLLYEPDAKAFHHHRIDLEESLKRMETIGKSLKTIAAINPLLGERMPQGWKMLAYRILAMLPTIRGRHTRAFLRGVTQS